MAQADNSPSPIMQEMTALKASMDETRTTLARLAAQRDVGGVATPATPVWLGKSAPSARRGENIMGSRGFSFGKLIGALTNKISADESKIEGMLCQKTANLALNNRFQCVASGGQPCLAPIWPDGFNEQFLSNDDYYEMKGLLAHGVAGADPDEMAYWHKRITGAGQKAAASPAMSWTDQSLGGTFVPPPAFGAPIELLRNKEALMRAGCTVVPMSPSGRITYPRLTSPTTGVASPENNAVTPVTAGTGSLNLISKKMMSVVVLPGELLRYAAPATEALIRADIFKTVALLMDYYLLQGPGSDNVPLGLATMGATSGNPYGMAIVTPNASNQLAGQDAYKFLSAIEEHNGDTDALGWIMRPTMAYAWYQARWTPYSGGTSQGGFLFEITRGLDGKATKHLAGHPITASTQVSNTRGNGQQTYILCAPWEDYILALFGAIEFAQTDQGLTLFQSDQVAIRAILSGDGGPRHPGVFAFADQLNQSISG